MKLKLLLIPFTVTATLTTQIWASDDYHIIAAGEKNPVSIAIASQLSDETAVSVTGIIVGQVKREHYLLKDQSGSIVVDIDDDLARPEQLKNGTKVKVIAEVDTHRHRPTDLDAVKVDIL